MERARTGVARYHSPSCAQLTLEGQAPAVNVRRVLLVIDHSGCQASTLEETCDCRIVDGVGKCKHGSSTNRVGRKNRADLSERGHLLNIRPQVIEHRMLVENAEAASHREFFISWGESESEARAEALERRVREELVYCAQGRKSRIELLRFLRQIHTGVEWSLHRRDQPIFLRR